MGQYLLLNYTRLQKVQVKRFLGFDSYIKLFNWSPDDEIVAYGDYGEASYHNPKAPVNLESLDEKGVWQMCVFAAKKIGVTPEIFYSDFLNENSSLTTKFEILNVSDF